MGAGERAQVKLDVIKAEGENLDHRTLQLISKVKGSVSTLEAWVLGLRSEAVVMEERVRMASEDVAEEFGA